MADDIHDGSGCKEDEENSDETLGIKIESVYSICDQHIKDQYTSDSTYGHFNQPFTESRKSRKKLKIDFKFPYRTSTNEGLKFDGDIKQNGDKSSHVSAVAGAPFIQNIKVPLLDDNYCTKCQSDTEGESECRIETRSKKRKLLDNELKEENLNLYDIIKQRRGKINTRLTHSTTGHTEEKKKKLAEDITNIVAKTLIDKQMSSCCVVIHSADEYLKGRQSIQYRHWSRSYDKCHKQCRQLQMDILSKMQKKKSREIKKDKNIYAKERDELQTEKGNFFNEEEGRHFHAKEGNVLTSEESKGINTKNMSRRKQCLIEKDAGIHSETKMDQKSKNKGIDSTTVGLTDDSHEIPKYICTFVNDRVALIPVMEKNNKEAYDTTTSTMESNKFQFGMNTDISSSNIKVMTKHGLQTIKSGTFCSVGNDGMLAILNENKGLSGPESWKEQMRNVGKRIEISNEILRETPYVKIKCKSGDNDSKVHSSETCSKNVNSEEPKPVHLSKLKECTIAARIDCAKDLKLSLINYSKVIPVIEITSCEREWVLSNGKHVTFKLCEPMVLMEYFHQEERFRQYMNQGSYEVKSQLKTHLVDQQRITREYIFSLFGEYSASIKLQRSVAFHLFAFDFILSQRIKQEQEVRNDIRKICYSSSVFDKDKVKALIEYELSTEKHIQSGFILRRTSIINTFCRKEDAQNLKHLINEYPTPTESSVFGTVVDMVGIKGLDGDEINQMKDLFEVANTFISTKHRSNLLTSFEKKSSLKQYIMSKQSKKLLDTAIRSSQEIKKGGAVQFFDKLFSNQAITEPSVTEFKLQSNTEAHSSKTSCQQKYVAVTNDEKSQCEKPSSRLCEKEPITCILPVLSDSKGKKVAEGSKKGQLIDGTVPLLNGNTVTVLAPSNDIGQQNVFVNNSVTVGAEQKTQSSQTPLLQLQDGKLIQIVNPQPVAKVDGQSQTLPITSTLPTAYNINNQSVCIDNNNTLLAVPSVQTPMYNVPIVTQHVVQQPQQPPLLLQSNNGQLLLVQQNSQLLGSNNIVVNPSNVVKVNTQPVLVNCLQQPLISNALQQGTVNPVITTVLQPGISQTAILPLQPGMTTSLQPGFTNVLPSDVTQFDPSHSLTTGMTASFQNNVVPPLQPGIVYSPIASQGLPQPTDVTVTQGTLNSLQQKDGNQNSNPPQQLFLIPNGKPFKVSQDKQTDSSVQKQIREALHNKLHSQAKVHDTLIPQAIQVLKSERQRLKCDPFPATRKAVANEKCASNVLMTREESRIYNDIKNKINSSTHTETLSNIKTRKNRRKEVNVLRIDPDEQPPQRPIPTSISKGNSKRTPVKVKPSVSTDIESDPENVQRDYSMFVVKPKPEICVMEDPACVERGLRIPDDLYINHDLALPIKIEPVDAE